MSWLSRLFGKLPSAAKPQAPEHEPVEYKGFTIRPEPVPDGTSWRVAARIEKQIDGETKSHHLIRADLLSDPETAAAESARKARQLIDERDERLFDRPR